MDINSKRLAFWPPSSDRNIYVVWIATVWGAVLAGFGLDFGRYIGEAPAPPLFLHFHAFLYVAWLVLVSIQIFLVEAVM